MRFSEVLILSFKKKKQRIFSRIKIQFVVDEKEIKKAERLRMGVSLTTSCYDVSETGRLNVTSYIIFKSF